MTSFSQPLSFSHHTRYFYSDSVLGSHQLIRLTPTSNPEQKVLEHTIKVEPFPGPIDSFLDTWGNIAGVFQLSQAHQSLTVSSWGRIERTPRVLPPRLQQMTVDEVRKGLSREAPGEWVDPDLYSVASPQVSLQKEFSRFSEGLFASYRPFWEGALELSSMIHRHFSYVPGVTGVDTPLGDFYRMGKGVCQDFAHFMIACIRCHGLPARYCTGYLFNPGSAGSSGPMRGADASHAWVEVYFPGFGWKGLDPTNNLKVGHEHILVATGRDFSDVSMIKGMVTGGGSQKIEVAVEVQKEELSQHPGKSP